MYTHFRIIYCNGAVWVGRGDFLKEWVGSWLWLVGSINCSGYWWVWLEKLKVYIRYEASLLDKLSILQWFQEVIVFNGWGMFDVIGHLEVHTAADSWNYSVTGLYDDFDYFTDTCNVILYNLHLCISKAFTSSTIMVSWQHRSLIWLDRSVES